MHMDNVEDGKSGQTSKPVIYHMKELQLENGIGAQNEKICRVCLTGDEEGQLYHPCLCKGTMMYVHEPCLMQWLDVKTGGPRCDICNHQFKSSFQVSPGSSIIKVLPMKLCSLMSSMGFYLRAGAFVASLLLQQILVLGVGGWLNMGWTFISPMEYWGNIMGNIDIFWRWAFATFLVGCMFFWLLLHTSRLHNIQFTVLENLTVGTFFGFNLAIQTFLTQLGTFSLQIGTCTLFPTTTCTVGVRLLASYLESRKESAYIESKLPPWTGVCLYVNTPQDMILAFVGESMTGLIVGVCFLCMLCSLLGVFLKCFSRIGVMLRMYVQEIFIVVCYPIALAIVLTYVHGDPIIFSPMYWPGMWYVGVGTLFLLAATLETMPVCFGIAIEPDLDFSSLVYPNEEPKSVRSHKHVIMCLSKLSVYSIVFAITCFQLPMLLVQGFVCKPSLAMQCITWLHSEFIASRCSIIPELIRNENNSAIRIAKGVGFKLSIILFSISFGICMNSDKLFPEIVRVLCLVLGFFWPPAHVYPFDDQQARLMVGVFYGAWFWNRLLETLQAGVGGRFWRQSRLFFTGVLLFLLDISIGTFVWSCIWTGIFASVKTHELPIYTWQAPLDILNSSNPLMGTRVNKGFVISRCFPGYWVDYLRMATFWTKLSDPGQKVNSFLQGFVRTIVSRKEDFGGYFEYFDASILTLPHAIYIFIYMLEVFVFAVVLDGIIYASLGYTYSTDFLSLYRSLLVAKYVQETFNRNALHAFYCRLIGIKTLSNQTAQPLVYRT